MHGRLLRAVQVAEVLGVSQWTVYAYAREGRLPSRELGPRCIRFTAEDVAEFIEDSARSGRSR